MCIEESKFLNIDPSVVVEVTLADGKQILSKGVGTCLLETLDVNGERKSLKLSETLFMPDLDNNLLSVLKLTSKGGKVTFENNECTIEKGGLVAAKATAHGGLYYVDNITMPQAMKVCHQSDCVHSWHRKLGHRDNEAILKLEKLELATGIKIGECGARSNTCECCVEGKMTRLPFPKKAKRRSKAILDLIHSDVCGPMNTRTPGGCRYFLTLIDDFSRYTTVFFLKRKSEVTGCFKQFVRAVENRFGQKPKIIRSDQGGEFSSSEIKTFCEAEGIQQQFTTAYTPQQNGVAERKNRSLVEMARCMILDAKLPYKFWAEAVNTANYLQNLLPTAAVKQTPFELWNEEKPDLTHLQVFGTPAFAHIPKEKRSKLDPRAVKLIFVGYSDSHKGYRLIDSKTHKLVISRDVRFIPDETVFVDEDEAIVEYEFSDTTNPVRGNHEADDEFENEDQSVDSSMDEEFFDPTIMTEDEAALEGNSMEIQEETDETFTNHSEIRRSSRNNKGVPPPRYPGMALAAQSRDPRTVTEARNSSHWDKWQAAMEEEMESLRSNKTWVMADLPDGKRAVGCKWIFKTKENDQGEVVRYKARLVAQGFTQKYGCDYDEVFAPVAKQTTLRTLLAVAGRRNMMVKHLDVKTAYLYGELDEQIFMHEPPGFETNTGKVCCLKKSLYGLKQSARMWNKKIDSVFRRIGFKPSDADPCLYMRQKDGKHSYILLYVDDMLVIASSQEEYNSLVAYLGGHFALTVLGDARQFLGIQIKRTGKGFSLSQETYIKKLVSRFGLEDAKPSKVPMEPGYIQQKEESTQLPSKDKYQSLIGGLLYIAVNTRPDIAISASILGRKVSCPTAEDWCEAKRTLRYLHTTCKLKLCLECKDEELTGFADADWAGNASDRKSNTGFLFQLGGAPIAWAARKQSCVALSSTEAEYISLAESCQELLWILKLLKSIGEEVEYAVTLGEDNQSCIKQLKQDSVHQRSKHVDTRYHFIKDLYRTGVINVVYVPTNEMVADILTKPLGRVKLEYFRSKLGLRVEEE